MIPQYKLTYFNGRGLAEPIRLIFVYSNIPYEDVRISNNQWDDNFKKTTPYGKLPMLAINGKVMGQSRAIAKYLARKYNLAGNDDWDAAQCDVVVDTITDLLLEIRQWETTEDVQQKTELEAKIKNESIPTYLEMLEKTVAQNGGHLVASKLTWADLYMTCMVDSVEQDIQGNLLNNYPGLKKLQEKVCSIPTIATWRAKRPVTEF